MPRPSIAVPMSGPSTTPSDAQDPSRACATESASPEAQSDSAAAQTVEPDSVAIALQITRVHAKRGRLEGNSEASRLPIALVSGPTMKKTRRPNVSLKVPNVGLNTNCTSPLAPDVCARRRIAREASPPQRLRTKRGSAARPMQPIVTRSSMCREMRFRLLCWRCCCCCCCPALLQLTRLFGAGAAIAAGSAAIAAESDRARWRQTKMLRP
jgi:hypothetical protein